jgi:hypothetical protein
MPKADSDWPKGWAISNGRRRTLAAPQPWRPDAVFLFLIRAHVVDSGVISEMLPQGRFRAGIDIYPEKPLLKDHPIRQGKVPQELQVAQPELVRLRGRYRSRVPGDRER